MQKNCWPTTNQELLLRACLLRGDEALLAWDKWKLTSKTELLDEGSRRLLPLLYRNLTQLNVTDARMGALKEQYFHTWSQNQFSLRRLATLLTAFNEAGMPTMILKGAALSLLWYKDLGLRPMRDIDVLVPTNQAALSMQLLRGQGWVGKYRNGESLIPFEQATEFVNADKQNLDLHWRLMWEGRQDVDDAAFWKSSVSLEVNGIETRALEPADQLLHVCVHGAKWNDTPSLRFVADAMMIIQDEKAKVDWSRVLEQATQRRLTLPMRDTLSYLKNLLDAEVPDEVLDQLRATEPKRFERWSYQARLGSNDAFKMPVLVHHWIGSLYMNCEGNILKRFNQFSLYLQSLWSIPERWQVPFYLLGKPLRRLYWTIGPRMNTRRRRKVIKLDDAVQE